MSPPQTIPAIDSGEFFLKRGFEFGIAGSSKTRPINRRFNAFAVGGAEPDFDREPGFANQWVFFQLEAFGQFDLDFRGLGSPSFPVAGSE